MCGIGQHHIYTVYAIFWQGDHQIYGHIRCIYTVLANPEHVSFLSPSRSGSEAAAGFLYWNTRIWLFVRMRYRSVCDWWNLTYYKIIQHTWSATGVAISVKRSRRKSFGNPCHCQNNWTHICESGGPQKRALATPAIVKTFELWTHICESGGPKKRASATPAIVKTFKLNTHLWVRRSKRKSFGNPCHWHTDYN